MRETCRYRLVRETSMPLVSSKLDSKRGPLRVVAAVMWAAMIFAFSSTPHPTDREGPLARIPHVDKAVHFMLYAGLGFLVYQAGSERWRGGRAVWAILAVVIASLCGVGDEWNQVRVPGRTPSPMDWFFDTQGALAGVLIAARSGA